MTPQVQAFQVKILRPRNRSVQRSRWAGRTGLCGGVERVTDKINARKNTAENGQSEQQTQGRPTECATNRWLGCLRSQAKTGRVSFRSLPAIRHGAFRPRCLFEQARPRLCRDDPGIQLGGVRKHSSAVPRHTMDGHATELLPSPHGSLIAAKVGSDCLPRLNPSALPSCSLLHNSHPASNCFGAFPDSSNLEGTREHQIAAKSDAKCPPMPALARPNPFPSTTNRRIFAPCRVCSHTGFDCASLPFLLDSQGFAPERCPHAKRGMRTVRYGPQPWAPCASSRRTGWTIISSPLP